MNNLVHLDLEDDNFVENFMKSKHHCFSSPSLFSDSNYDQEINDQIVENPPKEIQEKIIDLPPKTTVKITTKKTSIFGKFKNRFFNKIRKRKEDNRIPSITHEISENNHKKIALNKNFSGFSPLILNNIKLFVNKLKRWAYLTNISLLKSSDLRIINDQAYFKKEVKSRSDKWFLGFRLFLKSIINFWMNLLHIKKNCAFFIHPYSTFKMIWDLLNSLVIILLLFYIPLEFCFGAEMIQDEEYHIKFCIAFLIGDMIIEMNSLYFNCGIEVRNKQNIIINYFKTSFLTDLLGIIAIFFHLYDMEFIPKILEIMIFLKVFTLFRISKKLNNRFQFNHKMKGIKELILFIFFLVLVTHLVACSWYYLGISKSNLDEQGKFNKTWITEYNIFHDDLKVKYVTSFYWSIVTIMTVGYGDITPQNISERIYCIFVILFGCMMFPYSINCIGLIIQNMKKDQIRFDNTLDIINGYMTRKGIKPELQTRIREYLNFIWREEKSQNMEDEEKIIQSLSHSLKEELLIDAYGFFLKNNPLFTKNFSENSLKKMVLSMKELFLTPGDIIFMQNNKEECPGIYFIGKGNVKIYSEQNNKTPILLKELKEGDYFGEMSFFTNLKRENTAVCNKFCTLFMIKQEDFLNILKEYKPDYETFMMIKDKLLLSNDYSSINKKCFSCGQFTHIIEECPKLHYVPNVERIIKKLTYPFLNKRQIYKRRCRKTQNGLINLMKNPGICQKLKINIKNNKTLINMEVSSEENFLGSVDDYNTETNFNKNELLLNNAGTYENLHITYNEKDKILSDIDDNIEKKHKTNESMELPSNVKAKISDNLISFSEEKKPMTSSLSMKNILSKENKELRETKNETNSESLKKFTSKILYKEESQKKNSIDYINANILSGLERAQSFKNYFNEFNLEKLIKNHAKTIALGKEVNKRYLKTKYKNFKHYTFYTFEILEKFIQEKKNNRRKGNKLTSNNENKNVQIKSICSDRRKSVHGQMIFFHSETKPQSNKINDFGELIKTLIKTNKKPKE